MKHTIEDRFPNLKTFEGAGYNPFRPELFGWMNELGLTYQEIVIVLTLDFFRKPGASVVYPGIGTLADILKLHPMSFHRPLQRLVKKGMIKITRGKPGRGTPNKYDLSGWLAKMTELANSEGKEEAKATGESVPVQAENRDVEIKLKGYEKNLEEALASGDREWENGIRAEMAKLHGEIGSAH